MIPGTGAGPGAGEPPEVHLVREYKGPTVDQLLQAAPRVLDVLPGRLRSMEKAVRRGDLAAADAQMERAVGLVHAGPGHRPQPSPGRLIPAFLWFWFAILVVAVVWLLA